MCGMRDKGGWRMDDWRDAHLDHHHHLQHRNASACLESDHDRLRAWSFSRDQFCFRDRRQTFLFVENRIAQQRQYDKRPH